jgi:AcrR family transcriptional regulator
VNRWERKRRERIDSILAVTARELTERGYHHMSLEDVASALDLTKASLYHYFDSKEETFRVLLDMNREDILRPDLDDDTPTIFELCPDSVAALSVIFRGLAPELRLSPLLEPPSPRGRVSEGVAGLRSQDAA